MYYASSIYEVLSTMELSKGIMDYTETRQALVKRKLYSEALSLDTVYRPILDELQRRRMVSIGQDFGQLMRIRR